MGDTIEIHLANRAHVHEAHSSLSPRLSQRHPDTLRMPTQDPMNANIGDLLTCAGADASKISLLLGQSRREFENKLDLCNQMERDDSLLRVRLGEAYGIFWRSKHRG